MSGHVTHSWLAKGARGREGQGRRLAVARSKAARGQALVEFALGMAILSILLLGVIEFGMLVYSYIVVVDATDEAASYAALYPYERDLDGNCPPPCRIDNDADIAERVRDASIESIIIETDNYYTITVTPDYLHRRPCEQVTVTAFYRYNFLTPLFFGRSVDLHYQVTKLIVPEGSYGDCMLPNP